MTTPSGQDPRPGPTRGGPARPAPRGADSGWPGGGKDGRGTGQGRGSAGSGRDGVDGRRGVGNAAGSTGRTRRPDRGDPDPWRSLEAPARGRGRGDRGEGTGWAGRAGDRGGQGKGWDGRGEGGRGGSGLGRDGRGAGERGGPRQGWGGQRGPGGESRGGGGRVPRNRDGERGQADGAGRYPENRRRDRAGDRGQANRAAGLGELQSSPLLRWIGSLPTRNAIYIMAGAALIGVVGTLLTGTEPGGLLGFFIIAGSVVAAIGIQRRTVYLLIPLPALTFFVAAVLTGAVKDSSIDSTKTELGVNFLQWIADVFFGMCAATIIVLVIGGGRWLLSRQLVSGQFPMSAGPRTASAAGQRGDRDRRPSPRDSDPWGIAGSPDDRGDPGAQRASRGQIDPRDPWQDRRPPSSRDQPGRVPTDRTQPAGPPPGGRDPRGPRNQRVNRDPRDPWAQR